jgi:hypothetical protein
MEYKELINDTHFNYTADIHSHYVFIELYYTINGHTFPIAWAIKKDISNFLNEQVNNSVLDLIADIREALENNTDFIISNSAQKNNLDFDNVDFLQPIRGKRTRNLLFYVIVFK